MKFVTVIIIIWCSLLSAKVLLVPSQYATITSAINSASDYDTVYISAGVYLETLSISKNITLIGANGLQTMIRSSQSGEQGTVIKTPIITISSAVVTLKSLLISAYEWDPLYYGIDPSEVSIGIYGSNSTIIIDGCKIQRLTNFYLDVYSSNLQLLNSQLTDEHMLYSSDVACRVTGTVYHIQNNTMGYKIDHCISIESGSSGVVENNTLYGSDIYWGQGVRLNADGIVRNNIIIGRQTNATTPYFATASGVSVSSTWTTMVQIYGNTINGFQNGISCLYGHNSIYNNVIFNNVNNGIYISRNVYDTAQTDIGGGMYNSPGGNEIYGNGQYAIKNDCPQIMIYARNNNFHTSDTNLIKQEIYDPAHVIIWNTSIQAPSIPLALAASAISQTNFTANWNPVSNAAGYYLDVASDSGLVSIVNGYNNKDVGNVTSYTVNSNLAKNTKYFYRVKSYNQVGISSNSNIITLYTLPDVPGSPVAVSAALISQTSFTANWNFVISAAGYFIDVAADTGFINFVNGYNNKDIGNVTSYTVNSNLAKNTKYFYRIRAYNTGGISGNSNIISLTTSPNLPGAPISFPATLISQTSFTANWSSVDNYDGYFLDVALDTAFSNPVNGYFNKDAVNVTSLLVNTNLVPNMKYFYRVRAYNSDGTGANSNITSVLTLQNLPQVPTAISATSISQSGFTANWDSAEGASGYNLDVATDSIFTNIIDGYSNKDAGSSTSYSITGISMKINYYYRVRAYNVTGISGCSNVIYVESQDISGVKIINSRKPAAYYLYQNYPNPFNPVTIINWQLAKSGFVSIKVYNLLGNEVAILVNQFLDTGEYSISFNGYKFASGIYLYKIQAGQFIQTKKMIILK